MFDVVDVLLFVVDVVMYYEMVYVVFGFDGCKCVYGLEFCVFE